MKSPADKHLKTELCIALEAPVPKVWEALTSPEWTRKYMFNCTVQSTWKPGDPVIWRGNYEGYEAFQKGEVLAIEEGKLLRYTTFDPNYGMEDKPENYLHITYKLDARGKITELTVISETFDGDETRIGHVRQGFEMAMNKLSGLLTPL